jgi:hypothetical protein
MNRRNLITRGAISAAAVAFAPFATQDLLALTPPAFPTTSKSALALNQQKGVILYQKLASNTATQGDLESYAVTLEGLFGNLEEAGWNTALQSYVKANTSDAMYKDASTSNGQVLLTVQRLGLPVTSATMQDVFTATSAFRQSIVQQIAKSGLAPIEGQTVSNFESLANKAPYQTMGYDTSSPKPHLVLIEAASECSNLASACGMTALVAGLAGAEPIAGAFALCGVLYDIAARAGIC